MRKLRKPLSWLLAVCMLFSLLPGTALAADPDPAPVADTTTYTDWEDLFGVGGSAYLTTKDIGRIWTDKSVSTQDIKLPGTTIEGLTDNTVKKEAGADFLVALSGLGSAATIVDETKVPTDTVIVLDMAPEMEPYVEDMVAAANDALENLLTANPNNRIAVVAYGNTAIPLLPLDHYSNYSDQSPEELLQVGVHDNGIWADTTYVASYGKTDAGISIVEEEFEFDSGEERNTQIGIYTGMDLLLQTSDTTVTVDGVELTRMPVAQMVSISRDSRPRPRRRAVSTSRAYSSRLSSRAESRNSCRCTRRCFTRQSSQPRKASRRSRAVSLPLTVAGDWRADSSSLQAAASSRVTSRPPRKAANWRTSRRYFSRVAGLRSSSPSCRAKAASVSSVIFRGSI